MRTFASKTSRSSAGFSLLEVLVVITIMAVLTGVVVLGFTGNDQRQKQEGVAEQLSQRLSLVRQRSLQRNKTWGLVVEATGYSFSEYDQVNQAWIPQTERPFGPNAMSGELELRVQVEGETLVAGDTTEDERQPEVLFFASGEITPFTLTLETLDREVAWSIHSDGLSAIALERGELER